MPKNGSSAAINIDFECYIKLNTMLYGSVEVVRYDMFDLRYMYQIYII